MKEPIGAPVLMDPRTRTVVVGSSVTVLQEKSWQVFVLLAARAPAIVSRADIIELVWSGNFLVGNKGLNQALWSIRTALGDDARQPRYIRTIARIGYQWVHVPPAQAQSGTRPGRRWQAAAATLAVLSVGIAIATIRSESAVTSTHTGMEPAVSVAADGTRAYLRDSAIVVDMPEGCQRIVKADEAAVRFGVPVVSSDGKHVVFPVRKAAACKLVSLELKDGARTDFGSCPGWAT